MIQVESLVWLEATIRSTPYQSLGPVLGGMAGLVPMEESSSAEASPGSFSASSIPTTAPAPLALTTTLTSPTSSASSAPSDTTTTTAVWTSIVLISQTLPPTPQPSSPAKSDSDIESDSDIDSWTRNPDLTQKRMKAKLKGKAVFSVWGTDLTDPTKWHRVCYCTQCSYLPGQASHGSAFAHWNWEHHKVLYQCTNCCYEIWSKDCWDKHHCNLK